MSSSLMYPRYIVESLTHNDDFLTLINDMNYLDYSRLNQASLQRKGNNESPPRYAKIDVAISFPFQFLTCQAILLIHMRQPPIDNSGI